MPAFPLDPEILASKIDIPLDLWPGNCHGIAQAVLSHVPIAGMRLARGHFDGHVHRDSVYRSSGLQQHSWLVLEDGRILDPTRWAIESPARPFIHCGVNDHYDEAGLELRARMRPQMSLHMLMDTSARSPADAILEKITAAPRERVEMLFTCADIPLPHQAGAWHAAERIHDRLNDPIEHHRDPEGFFAVAKELGLTAFAPIDSVQRVLEPEKTRIRAGENLLFDPPPQTRRSEMQKLFLVFSRFLSIEDRDGTIEAELDEVGLTIDDLHDALNAMELSLKYDPQLEWMPRDARANLSLAASEILGRGFGMTLRVERFAASLDLDRAGLHRALYAFGDKAGYILTWLCGDEARRAEEEHGGDHADITP